MNTVQLFSPKVLLDAAHGWQRYVKKEYGFAQVLATIDRFADDTESTWFGIAAEAQRLSVPVKVVGAGSNLFISKEGFAGLFVVYRYPDGVIQIDGSSIICPAGVALEELIDQAAAAGLDLAYLAGIPGTVGGAMLGNAGSSSWKRNIGEVTEEIRAYDLLAKESVIYRPSEMPDSEPFFEQRGTYLKAQNLQTTRYVIREVVLQPPTGAPEMIRQKITERLRERRNITEEGWGTSGSFFAAAILPERLSNQDGRRLLVRDLVIAGRVSHNGRQMLIPELSIEGARFTSRYAFLKTAEQTTDHDVAVLLDTVLAAIWEQYQFVPRVEVDLIGSSGSMSIAEFITRFK